MAIDTLDTRIRPVEKLQFADDEDDFSDFPRREGLSWYAEKVADMLSTISRGFMLISGEPGGGKDLFAVSTCSLFKYIFGRGIILDFLPKRAFGEYTLMNTTTIIEKITEIAKSLRVGGIEGSNDKKELAQFMEDAVMTWLLEGEGYDIFNRKVYYISELKKVAYNRNPHSRTNKFIGSLGTAWRHLDLLTMGTHVKENEIDVKAFLEYAKLRAFCKQTMTPNVCKAVVIRGVYAGADFVVSNVLMKPLVFYIDGMEARDFLGGKNFFSLYKTKHMHF
jgi:hypothetical protein